MRTGSVSSAVRLLVRCLLVVVVVTGRWWSGLVQPFRGVGWSGLKVVVAPMTNMGHAPA